ncbi:MAG TPA: PTS sugar transporter subunit IIC [Myxococcales bacterium]|jgi:mannose/fructose/N-acetylgalactosamine-specific phosphotransferase system component IIC|nr:PTS sugar transporter subunit IIC [Myxococcales bacterium]
MGPAHFSLVQLLQLAAVSACIGGIAAVERKGALQLMLSRPLVLSPLLGWALGDAAGGLALGLPLELLFLGGVNLGGSIPQNETLLSAVLTAALVPAGRLTGRGVDPALAALGLALLYPLALAGRQLDRSAELRNGALLDAAVARAQAGDPGAANLNLRGLVLPLASTAALCATGTLCSPFLAALREALPGRLAVGLEGAWHAAWALSAACAIRAIRHRRSTWLSAGAALAVFAVFAAFMLAQRFA